MRNPYVRSVVFVALLGLSLFSTKHGILSGARSAEAAPAGSVGDSIVVNASKALNVRDPFRSHEDASAVEGTAILLPEKAGGQGKGLAEFDVKIPERGTYYAWVRARWRDSCGNSLNIMLDGGRAVLLGEDNVFGAWHWVRAGGPRAEKFVLSAGMHTVTILEREDGIAFDQVLFTTDQDYAPSAPIGVDSITPPVRLFADDFSRSPGHGMEAWELSDGNWEIAFSFDPNRIPNQYGLVGKGTNGETLALVKGAPWQGCRVEFSFSPQEPGMYGAVLDAGEKSATPIHIGMNMTGDSASLRISGAGFEQEIPLGNRVRLKQWHRIVVERWAWVLRVFIDDYSVFASTDAVPGSGLPGLFVRSGVAAFDDIRVQNVVYQADDGSGFTAPWAVAEGAKWGRPTEDDATEALIGRKGTTTLASLDLPVKEIILQEMPGYEGKCRAVADSAAGTVSLHADNGSAHVRRVAVRYKQYVPDPYFVCAYRFDKDAIESASDYEDFTPEEYRRMQRGPNANVTRRQMHVIPVITDWPNGQAPWLILRQNWTLRDGVLMGSGRNALLRYEEHLNALLDVRLRVRLAGERSEAEISLYNRPETGLRVRIGSGTGESELDKTNFLNLRLPADAKWHEIQVCIREGTAYARADKDDWARCAFTRGDGGDALFSVLSGIVEFDDVEFVVPERYERGRFYAFDRREPDWWREGGEWIDHAGIACAMASNWISLVAPRGRGMLWNKRSVKSDALVAVTVSENTEWFGWHRGGDMTHRHYPFDNIVAVLGTESDVETGYRLEVNSRNHSATVLYRDGKPVVTRKQDSTFPMRYIAGHSPYFPRRCRIVFVKRENIIRGIVNGQEVIRYEDPEPLDVRTVGLGGYQTRANFSMVEVRDLGDE